MLRYFQKKYRISLEHMLKVLDPEARKRIHCITSYCKIQELILSTSFSGHKHLCLILCSGCRFWVLLDII